MTNADTPDNVRAAATAQRLLGAFPDTSRTETLTLPQNCVALWLFLGPNPDPSEVTVTGTTTGILYPCYQFPADNLNDENQPTLVIVAPQVDAAVTIAWSPSLGANWYVLSDDGPRVIIDAAVAASVGANAQPGVGSAVQVAGSDGAALRFLLTDAAGRLQIAGALTDAAEGSPGSAAPSKAIQVAGTDGANLRALLTDATGHPLTIDQTVKLIVSLINTALPTSAALIGGSDGVNLRPLLTGSTGILEVHDATLAVATAIIGGAIPARAMTAGVSDGTSLRALRGDAAGVPYVIPTAPSIAAGDHPPVELIVTSFNSTSDFQHIVAAPGAGKRIRLFSAELNSVFPATGTTSAFLYDDTSVTHLAVCLATPGGGFPGSFRGGPSGVPLTTNAGLEITNNGAGQQYFCTVVYTIETV